MEEVYSSEQALEFILEKFKDMGDYDFIEGHLFNEMVERVLKLDEEYMKESGVEEGGVYDDDEAYEYMHEKMMEEYPEYKMYMMRLVEDYMEFNEQYLESVGAIEWE